MVYSLEASTGRACRVGVLTLTSGYFAIQRARDTTRHTSQAPLGLYSSSPSSHSSDTNTDRAAVVVSRPLIDSLIHSFRVGH
jgi:hypothetical protein